MNVYIFSTPSMCSGILINAKNLNDAKAKIRKYLNVKRLPRYTTVEEYFYC